MFGVPGAKRVCRADLDTQVSSPRASLDRDIEALMRLRANDAFTFTITNPTGKSKSNGSDLNDQGDEKIEEGEDEDETELRLFAVPANAVPKSYKIKLAAPEESKSEPSIAVRKPTSFYFTPELTSQAESNLRAAALDGAAVLEIAKQYWPGCSLPWKVQHISATGLKKEVVLGHHPKISSVKDQAKVRKRTRKSKKTRIAIRKKFKAKEEGLKNEKEKEESERQKRTRKNREKKVKKKAREKAKKAMEAGDESKIV